jgi:hypothetical protein
MSGRCRQGKAVCDETEVIDNSRPPAAGDVSVDFNNAA